MPPRLPGRHSAALNLDLTAALAGQNAPAGGWDPRDQPLGFRVLPAEEDRAAALLAGLPHPLSGPLAIHPGSGAPVKRWRPEAWAALGESLLPSGEGLGLTGSARLDLRLSEAWSFSSSYALEHRRGTRAFGGNEGNGETVEPIGEVHRVSGRH